MSVIVFAKVIEGICVSSDSAATITNGSGQIHNIYNNAKKIHIIFDNPCIAATSCGLGNIGDQSITQIFNEIKNNFENKAKVFPGFDIRKEEITVERVSKICKSFITEKLLSFYGTEGCTDITLECYVMGFSYMTRKSEVYCFGLANNRFGPNLRLLGHDEYSINYSGQRETIDKIINGTTFITKEILDRRLGPTASLKIFEEIVMSSKIDLITPLMPLREAGEVCKNLVNITKFVSSYTSAHHTVGGETISLSISSDNKIVWF